MLQCLRDNLFKIFVLAWIVSFVALLGDVLMPNVWFLTYITLVFAFIALILCLIITFSDVRA